MKVKIFMARNLSSVFHGAAWFWSHTLLSLVGLRQYFCFLLAWVISTPSTLSQALSGEDSIPLDIWNKNTRQNSSSSYGFSFLEMNYFYLWRGNPEDREHTCLAFKLGARTRAATQEPHSVVLATFTCLVLAMAKKPIVMAILVENLSG